jgi:hypothetical protein
MSSGLPTLRIIFSHLRAAQEWREQRENGIEEREESEMESCIKQGRRSEHLPHTSCACSLFQVISRSCLDPGVRGDGKTLRIMKFVAPDELPLSPAMILTELEEVKVNNFEDDEMSLFCSQQGKQA